MSKTFKFYPVLKAEEVHANIFSCKLLGIFQIQSPLKRILLFYCKAPEMFYGLKIMTECFFLNSLYVVNHSCNIHSVFTRLQTTGPNHIVTGLLESHSSPDTQTVGSLHRLTVSQQKAAITSKPLQQSLRGLASNSPIVNGLDQNPLPLHAASLTHICSCECATDSRSR